MVTLDVDFIPVRVFQTQGRGLLLSGGFAIASTPGYSYRSPGLASRPFGRRLVEKTLSEEVRESLAGARFPSFRTPSGRKDVVRGSQKVARRGSLPVLSDAIRSKRGCPRKSESRSPRIVLWTLSEVGRLSSNDLCPLSFSDDIISTIFDDIISTRGYNGNCRGVAISIFWNLG